MKTFKEWVATQEAKKYGSVLVGKYDTDDELERAGISTDREELPDDDLGDERELDRFTVGGKRPVRYKCHRCGKNKKHPGQCGRCGY